MVPTVTDTGPDPFLSPMQVWARDMAPKVGIPEVALRAYGEAELAVRLERPECNLPWVTLAGIGRIESDHGRYGGGTIKPDGTSTKPIIGIPLNGVNVAHISDSDHGRWDGDPRFDRAIGPMQFIPSTWKTWGVDADGDGVANPFSLFDASLAAGNYLCANGGGDLLAPGKWQRALWGYNRSNDYAVRVTDAANAYAQRAMAQ